MGPLAEALKAAQATRVDPGEFRTLDGNASLLRPLFRRDFQVWKPPNRKARYGEQCHNWRLGVRLGPGSKCVSDLDATPPGIRKTGFREVMEVLRSPRQVGYPPSVATDARLGLTEIVRQAAEALFDRC